MSFPRVLLVDHDVDALAELAGQLRARGVKVSLANGSQMACERAKSGSYDVVIAARDVAEPVDGTMGVIDALSVELTRVPPLLVLVNDGPDAGADAPSGDTRLRRGDVERIVQRIESLSAPKNGPSGDERHAHPSLSPSSHALDHVGVHDLMIVLGTERRSGTLTVTTAKGSGEVRLVDGEVADAVYVRLEGMKAVTRMIAEREGTATFAPGAPAIMRRMNAPTREIVDEARALAARAETLRAKAGAIATGTLIATEGGPEDAANDVDQNVLVRLRVPATLDELLDELPYSDAAILESTLALDRRGRIKQLGQHSSRVQLCGADQLHLVRASAARAKSAGFVGAARLVFAATASRLAVLGHTILSLSDALPPGDVAPPLPVPHPLSTMRLGDGVELDVVALPLVPAYAPLWPLVLAGAAVAVRLDDGAAEALEEACASVGVTILDAQAVFGTLDESSPVQVASLIRTALEADPGG